MKAFTAAVATAIIFGFAYAHATGIYHSEILRANKVMITASATDQVIISITGMTMGDYDCSANGGFDQPAPPPGTIYHVKAGISSSSSLPAGSSAGRNSTEVPFNKDGTYFTIPAGTVRLYNTTTANLIVNAYFDTSTASAFGYLQCVGPQ